MAAICSPKTWIALKKGALLKAINTGTDSRFVIDSKPSSPHFKAHGAPNSAYENYTSWYNAVEHEYFVELRLVSLIPPGKFSELPWDEWAELPEESLQPLGLAVPLAKVLISGLRGDAFERMNGFIHSWRKESGVSQGAPPLTVVKEFLAKIFSDRGDTKVERAQKAMEAYDALLRQTARSHGDVEKWMSRFQSVGQELARTDQLYAGTGCLQREMVMHMPVYGGRNGVLYDDLKKLTSEMQKEPGKEGWIAFKDMSLSDIQDRVQKKAVQMWSHCFKPFQPPGGDRGRAAAVDRRGAQNRGRGNTRHRGGRGGGRGSHRGGPGGGQRAGVKRPISSPEGFQWHAGYLIPSASCFNCLKPGHSAAECTVPRRDKASRVQSYKQAGLQKVPKAHKAEEDPQDSK